MFQKIVSKFVGEVNTFPQTLEPLMWLNRIMGVSIIESPIGHPWLKLSIINIVIRFVLYTSLLFYGESTIFRKSNLEFESSHKVYYTIRHINIALMAVSTVLNIFSYRAKFLHVKRIAMTDAFLKEFGVDPEYSNERRRNFFICLIWCTLTTAITITAYLAACHVYNSNSETLIKIFTYTLPVSTNLLLQLQIGEKIAIMARRFKRLNGLTHRIVDSIRDANAITKDVNKNYRISQRNQLSTPSEDNSNKHKDNIIFMLKTVRQIHLYLCMTAREIIDTYGTEILLEFSLIFIQFTGASFITYLVFIEPTAPPVLKFSQYIFLWTLITISLVVMVFIINSAISIMEKAKKASYVAHEIQSSDPEVLNEMHQFSLQVMQHPLYLTASGYFVLDFVYIRGFIGAAATYFMILIQKRNGNKASDEIQ